MDKYFPSWLSAKAFLLAALLTAVGVFGQYAGYSFGIESIVGFVVSTLIGGIFWGWILTKFLPRWFGKSRDEL